jgi:hypothetical protein
VNNACLKPGLAAAVKSSGVSRHETSVDFSQYHTYSWLKMDAGNPLWIDRIKRDVNGQLNAKGWMEVPSGGDAAVSAFGATHNKQLSKPSTMASAAAGSGAGSVPIWPLRRQ